MINIRCTAHNKLVNRLEEGQAYWHTLQTTGCTQFCCDRFLINIIGSLSDSSQIVETVLNLEEHINITQTILYFYHKQNMNLLKVSNR